MSEAQLQPKQDKKGINERPEQNKKGIDERIDECKVMGQILANLINQNDNKCTEGTLTYYYYKIARAMLANPRQFSFFSDIVIWLMGEEDLVKHILDKESQDQDQTKIKEAYQLFNNTQNKNLGEFQLNYDLMKQMVEELFTSLHPDGNNTSQEDKKREEQPVKKITESNQDGEISKSLSNFSASFYGPLFEEAGEVKKVVEEKGTEEEKKQHGYYFLEETHKDNEFFRYDSSDESIMYRQDIMMYLNKQEQNMLHLACQQGDKHFVTMLIYEASADGQRNNYDQKASQKSNNDCGRFMEKMLHWKDHQGLTPVFHLCMKGFHDSDFKNKNDWLVFNTMLSNGIGTNENQKKLKAKIKEEDKREKIQINNADIAMLNKDTEVNPVAISEFENKNKSLIYNDANKKQRFREMHDELEYSELLKQSLAYTTHKPEKDEEFEFLDKECRRNTRSYLVKLLIDYGADLNLRARQNFQTPIHWLAYWGDYRAIRVVLSKNQNSLIKFQCQKCKEKSQKIIGKSFSYTWQHQIEKETQSECSRCEQKIKETRAGKYGALNLFVSSDKQTPVDVAGDMQHSTCVQVFLEYFSSENIKNQQLLAVMDNPLTKARYGSYESSTKVPSLIIDPVRKGTVQVSLKHLEFDQTPCIQAILSVAYWALSVPEAEKRVKESEQSKYETQFETNLNIFISMLIIELGVSPFMPANQEKKNLLQACVISQRQVFLKNILSLSYELNNKEDAISFVHSISGQARREDQGWNIYHQIYHLDDDERPNFLKILQETQIEVVYVGKENNVEVELDHILNKRQQKIPKSQQKNTQDQKEDDENGKVGITLIKDKPTQLWILGQEVINKLGLMPIELESSKCRFAKIKDYHMKHSEDNKAYIEMRDSFLQSNQADVAIVIKQQHEHVIVQSLETLKLKKDHHFFIVKTEEEKVVKTEEEKDDKEVIIALKYNEALLSKLAQEKNIRVQLDKLNLKVPFRELMENSFIAMEARNKFQLIEFHLTKAFDSSNLFTQSEDKNHKHPTIQKIYYLGNIQHKDMIEILLKRHCNSLIWKFFFPSWASLNTTLTQKSEFEEQMELLNYIKRYYGEKMSFYFTFALFTIGMLLRISLFAAILFVLKLVTGRMMILEIDHRFTIWYSLILVFWASLFVENWNFYETSLINEWNLENLQELRTETQSKEFKSEQVYNVATKTVHNQQNTPRKSMCTGILSKPGFYQVLLVLITVLSAVAIIFQDRDDNTSETATLSPLDQLQESYKEYKETIGELAETEWKKEFNENRSPGEVVTFISNNFFSTVEPWIYKFIVEILSYFSELAIMETIRLKNFRYQVDQDSSKQLLKFIFKFVTTFVPYLFVICWDQKPTVIHSLLFADFVFKPVLELLYAYFKEFLQRRKEKATKGNMTDNAKQFKEESLKQINQLFDEVTSSSEKSTDKMIEEKTQQIYRQLIKHQVKQAIEAEEGAQNACWQKYMHLDENYFGIVEGFAFIALFSPFISYGPPLSCAFMWYNFNYRFKQFLLVGPRQAPQITLGIEEYKYMINFISHVATVVNFFMFIFLSQTIRQLYVQSATDGYTDVCVANTKACFQVPSTPKMFHSYEKFIIFMVYTEHAVILIKFMYAKFISFTLNKNDTEFEIKRSILMHQHETQYKILMEFYQKYFPLKEKNKKEEEIHYLTKPKNYENLHYGKYMKEKYNDADFLPIKTYNLKLPDAQLTADVFPPVVYFQIKDEQKKRVEALKEVHSARAFKSQETFDVNLRKDDKLIRLDEQEKQITQSLKNKFYQVNKEYMSLDSAYDSSDMDRNN